MKLTRSNTIAEHIRINAQGYDRSGTYFGVGERVYRLDSRELFGTIVNKHGWCGPRILRAPSARAARDLANAEGYTYSAPEVKTAGYCDCACRDCMEIAIGKAGEALCHACQDAGCEANAGECSAEGAYGGES